MPFFLLFFVVATLILFNLLIGILTTAYGIVTSEQFRTVKYIDILNHDSSVTSWGGFEAFTLKTKIIRKLLVMGTRFLDLVCCCKEREGLENNYAKFWRQYIKLLNYMNSDDLATAIIGLASFINEFEKTGKNYYDDEDSPNPSIIDSHDTVRISTMAFLDEELGCAERRRHFEKTLVELPVHHINSYRASAWYDVLVHHNEYKHKVSLWAQIEEEPVGGFARIKQALKQREASIAAAAAASSGTLKENA